MGTVEEEGKRIPDLLEANNTRVESVDVIKCLNPKGHGSHGACNQPIQHALNFSPQCWGHWPSGPRVASSGLSTTPRFAMKDEKEEAQAAHCNVW